MKTRPWLILALAFPLVHGCGDKPATTTATTNSTTSSGSPLTAPVDYLKAAGQSQQKANKTVDLSALNQAIQLFNVDKGRNPKDLNELVTEKFLRQIPPAPYGTKIVYDAASGKVDIVKE